MKRTLGIATLIAVTAALVALPADTPEAAEQPQTVAIVNGRLWVGTGAPVIDSGAVVVEDGRILAAGEAEEVLVPPSARVIDAGGGFIMPGVIDNHMHMAGDNRLLHEDYFTPWLAAGVTTLVNNGGLRDGAVLESGIVIEDGVEFQRLTYEGLTERPPRMLTSGPMLTAPGGYPSNNPDPVRAQAAQFVQDPDDVRNRVARLIDEQAVDLIKVAIEAGGEHDVDDPTLPLLNAETLEAIVDATHERGLTARAHVTNEGELLMAIEAGFDVAAHTPFVPLSDDALDQAMDAGMAFVTTANIWGSTRTPIVAENAYRFLQLGGRVALGTDFPYQPGSQMPLKEMQALIDAGFTPREVLIAATRDGAAAVGRGADMGTLEPGKLADVIVVDGDPLTNINVMANVTVVMLEGEVVVGPSVPGDVNCDAKVDSVDAALILQFSAGLLADLPCADGADVDKSGDVTSLDAALVLQFVAGLLSELQ